MISQNEINYVLKYSHTLKYGQLLHSQEYRLAVRRTWSILTRSFCETKERYSYCKLTLVSLGTIGIIQTYSLKLIKRITQGETLVLSTQVPLPKSVSFIFCKH